MSHQKYNLFSSPEPMAQVSFSDHNLSVVRQRCCCCCCRRKLFTFSSSSPKPLGKFQPNLVQSILGWRGLKFIQMKGHAFFQGEIITKLMKLKNVLLQNHRANFNQTWHKSSLGKEDSNLFKCRAMLFSRGDNYEVMKMNWWNLKNLSSAELLGQFLLICFFTSYKM